MIKFFRKIRHRLFTFDQIGKYLLYAVGEIFLVVIGILIALQINTWNENHKKEKLKAAYVVSLVNDLSLDTLLMGKLLVENNNLMTNLRRQQNRFLGPDTPIDTLVKIVREEFNPELNTRFKYNRNTINTLISSGNIDLFSREFNELLMELIASQDIERENSKFYADVYSDKVSRFSDDYPVSGRIKSKIFNSLWMDIDERKIASRFISLTDIKGFAHYSINENIKQVKEQTTIFLDQIRNQRELLQ